MKWIESEDDPRLEDQTLAGELGESETKVCPVCGLSVAVIELHEQYHENRGRVPVLMSSLSLIGFVIVLCVFAFEITWHDAKITQLQNRIESIERGAALYNPQGGTVFPK